MADSGVTLDMARLDALIKNLPAHARQMAALLGEQIVTRTKELCPVDTGRLRASYASVVTSTADGATLEVGTDVNYAPFVEFGTSHAAAQPHLRPAVEEARAKMPGIAGATVFR